MKNVAIFSIMLFGFACAGVDNGRVVSDEETQETYSQLTEDEPVDECPLGPPCRPRPRPMNPNPPAPEPTDPVQSNNR